jgi:hypothetical protein
MDTWNCPCIHALEVGGDSFKSKQKNQNQSRIAATPHSAREDATDRSIKGAKMMCLA